MDWEKVDLTLEGHIGGDEHPNMPWEMRRALGDGDLYTHIFREHRVDGVGVLLIVDDHEFGRVDVISRSFDAREVEDQHEDNAANNFMEFFQRFPKWLTSTTPWLMYSIAGGDGCDRCGYTLNILNSSGPGCCDRCEADMNEQIASSPDVVFAFEGGGLRVVA